MTISMNRQTLYRAKHLSALLGFVFILCAFIAPAQCAGVPDADLDRLLLVSGMVKQVSDLPELMKMSLAPLKSLDLNMSDQDSRQIEQIIEQTMLPVEICSALKKSLKSSLNEADIAELFKWYDSENGKKVTAAEEKSTGPAAMQAIMARASEYLADEKRVALAKRLEKAVKSNELGMKIQREAGLAVFTLVSVFADPSSGFDVNAYAELLDSQAERIRPQMETLNLAIMVGSLKELELAEIEKYAAFHETPVAEKFTDCITESIVAVLGDCFRKMKEKAQALGASRNPAKSPGQE